MANLSLLSNYDICPCISIQLQLCDFLEKLFDLQTLYLYQDGTYGNHIGHANFLEAPQFLMRLMAQLYLVGSAANSSILERKSDGGSYGLYGRRYPLFSNDVPNESIRGPFSCGLGFRGRNSLILFELAYRIKYFKRKRGKH
uniref:CSON013017 protein n=1 Tax=Culicoides sonorensis TaxID=179676 RepID=A0A336LMG2_CULSO